MKLSEEDINIIVNKVIERLGKSAHGKTKEELKAERKIIKEVAEYTGISEELMKSRKRNSEYVRARYMVITELIRQYGYSLSKAAGVLGLNHATAHYAKRMLNGGDYQFTKYYKTYLQWKN